MPSPFPGMDPYLEAPEVWPGFHTTLLTAIRASLTPQLPPGFFADIEQHVWYQSEEIEDEVRVHKLDEPTIGRRDVKRKKRDTDNETTDTIRPVAVVMPNIVREVGQHTIRIRDGRSRKIVTTIELLSPSYKKPGVDRDRYLAKRNELIANGSHAVEIDLLRSGFRLPIEPVQNGDYYIYVTDAAYYNRVNVWIFTVKDSFPAVPVPLTRHHAPAVLALRPCLDRAYDEANYGPQIDYSVPTDPPLRSPMAKWAAKLLQASQR
ncbi:DUF4058 family protein [Fimbriiglobus ruber]|uniref:DUF4058 family protein n=1 Tax=Fimbriiglobus ruber TaxID=1908690 RepID=UPI00117ADEE4|nr:DUF4058 family protein [Fimbriiglobus ruber]